MRVAWSAALLFALLLALGPVLKRLAHLPGELALHRPRL